LVADPEGSKPLIPKSAITKDSKPHTSVLYYYYYYYYYYCYLLNHTSCHLSAGKISPIPDCLGENE